MSYFFQDDQCYEIPKLCIFERACDVRGVFQATSLAVQSSIAGYVIGELKKREIYHYKDAEIV